MRILKLEIENLNSLKGTWSIDFTHPDYAKNHDVFVICGPTGAGKTTLLDAITLALYGRTPRLEAINNGEGGNELMTRGTGFCRASVTYSCKKGIFTSEFQQNRAGMKSNGNLQKASFKITNNDDGQIVASGTGSNLKDETQKIIQLDYKQFCRSIMLAQGEFSAFLQSNARERAEILEKLTGTERYRKIGQNIAEKFSSIKKEFTLKKSQKDEIEKLILTEEAETQAKLQETELSEKLSQLDQEIELVRNELVFYDELERLQKDLENAKNQKEKAENLIKEFLPLEKKLELAKSAKNCETEFVTFQSLNANQQNELKTIDELGEKIIIAEKNAKNAQNELLNQEKELSELAEILKKVRQLDVQILAAEQKYSESNERAQKDENLVVQSKNQIEKLCSELENLEKLLEEQREYLEKNQNDEKLPQIIAKTETLKENALVQQKSAQEFAAKKDEIQSEIQKVEAEFGAAQSELKKIEAEITEFVSEEAVFIAKMLQLQLADGKPCPVCGSVYHKVHKNALQGELDLFDEAEKTDSHAENSADSEKSQKIAQQSYGLNAQREQIETLCQNLSSKLENLKIALQNTKSNLENAQKNHDEIFVQINQELSAWEKSASSENLNQIIEELSQKSSLWMQKNEDFKKNQSNQAAKIAEKNALEQNLAQQNQAFEKSKEELETVQSDLQKLKNARHEIFGTKSPDEEEKAKNHEIETLKQSVKKAEELQNHSKEEKSRLEAQKIQLEDSTKDRTPKLESAKTEFDKKCAENGFNSQEEFDSARMNSADFDELAKKSEQLKNQKTEAEISFANAQKSYDEYKSAAKVTRKKDEVLAEKTELLQNREQNNRLLIDIKTQLKTNAEYKNQAEKILKEFAHLQEEFSIWEQMSKWVGKSDGSDVSVFVQSLAFNSLLNLANKNLFGITGRYKVVQKQKNSLDFEIQDIYFEDNRSVENLSGGEKFLVSLSFALAISEFASRNVRVDSLFLDEGFGTLSGELLTEAINALKNLQKEGKMLGIITHVQDVINEIDQRIEVKPVSGGHSVLIGAGINVN